LLPVHIIVWSFTTRAPVHVHGVELFILLPIHSSWHGT
jgi:hypothetical protein